MTGKDVILYMCACMCWRVLQGPGPCCGQGGDGISDRIPKFDIFPNMCIQIFEHMAVCMQIDHQEGVVYVCLRYT